VSEKREREREMEIKLLSQRLLGRQPTYKLTRNGNWNAIAASLWVKYNIHQNCKLEFKRQELLFFIEKYIPGVRYYASKRLYKFTIRLKATELKDYS
jgi:hypothetical protein